MLSILIALDASPRDIQGIKEILMMDLERFGGGQVIDIIDDDDYEQTTIE